MDRNFVYVESLRSQIDVALRKESVDRNIWRCLMSVVFLLVALRKESVDRNCYAVFCHFGGIVALRKESVDRNVVSAFDVLAVSGRSPQGERG